PGRAPSTLDRDVSPAIALSRPEGVRCIKYRRRRRQGVARGEGAPGVLRPSWFVSCQRRRPKVSSGPSPATPSLDPEPACGLRPPDTLADAMDRFVFDPSWLGDVPPPRRPLLLFDGG